MNTLEDEQKQIAMPYRTVMDKLDSVAKGQQQLEVAFAKLDASIMPRHEIVIEIEKRMPVTSYIADKDAIMQRITKLEAQPQSTRAWVNTIIAGAGCLGSIVIGGVSLMIGAAGVIVSLIAIWLVSHP